MISIEARPTEARWRPSAFIRASAWLHGAAAVGAVAAPAAWPLWAGAVVLDHMVLTAAGLWPRSRLLGPNWVRLPSAAAARAEVALTIDDGPDPEVTPFVLDLLERHGARATFFCIGERVLRHPRLARDIVDRGHQIENHTMRHSHTFAFSGLGDLRGEIGAAQDAIAQVSGRRPVFFRAPAGLRNPLLQPALARLGLQLVAWTRRGFDTVTADPAVVSRRLLSGLAAGDILLLHDGNASRGRDGGPVAAAVLPAVLDAIGAAGLRTVTLSQALR